MTEVWERTSAFLTRGARANISTAEDGESTPMTVYKDYEAPSAESRHLHASSWSKPVDTPRSLWSWSEALALPSALDGMPIFSTSLGCLDAPHFYQNQTNGVTFSIPMATPMNHVELDLRGGAVGTLLITTSETPDLQLQLTVRADEHDLAQHIEVQVPVPDDKGHVSASHALVFTPNRGYLGMHCMRFDAVLRVPRALRTLTLHTYTLTHVLFDPSAHVELEDLSLFMMNQEPGNILLPHGGVRAARFTVDALAGWIAGEIPVTDHATVIARSDTRTRLVVRPTTVGQADSRVGLQTVNERGRMDVIVERDDRTRPIRARHDSSFMAELFLIYDKANFDGHIELDAWQAEAHNVHGAVGDNPGKWGDLWAGTRNGPDEVKVNAQGAWVGLFF
ncbi:hypothetical protein K488DRAFT_68090 [Vararia minispora EC-137]|uniref:Uncharacterized protein n=1 Tax=Vararia minispora EC-137 TaxID=1314806 RepID=A0ACB8QVK0_9AGAM|nr:hypothetical protein K488DRAFT_68090 [Vararia minispora EC-137]